MVLKRLSINILVFTITLVVGLGLLELALRVLGYEAAAGVQMRDHSDPDVARYNPGRYKDWEFTTEASYDDDGFRVQQNNCQQPDAKRVLIVGDSNIASIFVSDGSDLSAQLASILNRRGCYRVDAFGVSGFGPDQSLFAIEQLIQKQRYDVVVFHLFADNDGSDLIRNNNPIVQGRLRNHGYCYTKPHWLLDHSALANLVRTSLYNTSRIYWDWNSVVNSQGREGVCAAPFVSKSRDRLTDFALQAKEEFANAQQGKSSIYINDRYDVELACQSNPAATEMVKARVALIVKEFVALSRQQAFLPIFLIQPSERDVTHNHEINPTTLKQFCPLYQPETLTQLFTAQIGEQVPAINLYRDFLGCSDCYFAKEVAPYDDHWNAKGMSIAAQRLAEMIAPVPVTHD